MNDLLRLSLVLFISLGIQLSSVTSQNCEAIDLYRWNLTEGTIEFVFLVEEKDSTKHNLIAPDENDLVRCEVSREPGEVLLVAYLDLKKLQKLIDTFPKDAEFTADQITELNSEIAAATTRLHELLVELSAEKNPTPQRRDRLVKKFKTGIEEVRSKIFLKHQIARFDELEVHWKLSKGLISSLRQDFPELMISSEEIQELEKHRKTVEDSFVDELQKLVDQYRYKMLEPLDRKQIEVFKDAIKTFPAEGIDPEIENSLKFYLLLK